MTTMIAINHDALAPFNTLASMAHTREGIAHSCSKPDHTPVDALIKDVRAGADGEPTAFIDFETEEFTGSEFTQMGCTEPELDTPQVTQTDPPVSLASYFVAGLISGIVVVGFVQILFMAS